MNSPTEPHPDFSSLVERYSREIYFYIWRLVRSPQEAEDCLQETFLRALQAYPRLQPHSNYRAWLYKIAIHTTRSAQRKFSNLTERNSLELLDSLSLEDHSSSSLDHQALLAQVFLAVQQLPEKQKTAFLLRKYQGLEYDELALALDCTPQTARAHVYQALKKLKQQLSGENHD